MNYFFGLKSNIFKSKIQIPIFKNRSFKSSKLKLFKCYPKNNKWILTEIKKEKKNDFFYILDNEDISNNEIYFLADKKIFNEFDKNYLKNYNTFTDTSPAYRANLEFYFDNEGFASYQSEYPFSMIEKNGTILSSINAIANIEADENYVLIRNIFKEPIQEMKKGFFVNIINRKIEDEFEFKSNFSNLIKIKKSLIKPEIFLITKKYLGVPVFISTKNKYISCEHTHPPHEYFIGNKKFIKIKELKNEINEIIS